MGTWIVGTIVFACIGLAGYHVYRSKKAGEGCAGCASYPGCQKRDGG